MTTEKLLLIYFVAEVRQNLMVKRSKIFFFCVVGVSSGNLLGRVPLFDGAAGVIFVDLLYGFKRFCLTRGAFF